MSQAQWRIYLACALVVFTNLIGFARAETVQNEATVPSAAVPTLLLGPGDRIDVTVFGNPDLSGDRTVDGQGNIRLPMGNAIAAANVTPAELEKSITAALADGYIIEPRVSVRVAEYRPVYVLGNVRSAGAVAYHYGMTVLTAIALAGGSSSSQDTAGLRSDLLEAEQREQVLLNQRTALAARTIRLAAERDDAATLNFPPNLDDGSAATSKLLAGERAVFDSERDTEARQITLLQLQVAAAKTEVGSIASQVQLGHQQLDSLNSYLTDLQKLARNGLVERRRVVDLETEKAHTEANLAQLGTEAVHAAQLIQEAPLRISDIRAATRQRALLALQEANAQLTEVESNIEATRELIRVRRQRLGDVAMTDAPDRPSLLITRTTQDGPRAITAQETTPLLPGDIVRVRGDGLVRVSGAATSHTVMGQ